MRLYSASSCTPVLVTAKATFSSTTFVVSTTTTTQPMATNPWHQRVVESHDHTKKSRPVVLGTILQQQRQQRAIVASSVTNHHRGDDDLSTLSSSSSSISMNEEERSIDTLEKVSGIPQSIVAYAKSNDEGRRPSTSFAPRCCWTHTPLKYEDWTATHTTSTSNDDADNEAESSWSNSDEWVSFSGFSRFLSTPRQGFRTYHRSKQQDDTVSL